MGIIHEPLHSNAVLFDFFRYHILNSERGSLSEHLSLLNQVNTSIRT